MLIGPETFPSNVVAGDQTWLNARTLIWTVDGVATLGVWTADQTTVHLEAIIPLATTEVGFCGVWPVDLQAADGTPIRITRGHGCGCGSVLRAWPQKALIAEARSYA